MAQRAKVESRLHAFFLTLSRWSAFAYAWLGDGILVPLSNIKLARCARRGLGKPRKTRWFLWRLARMIRKVTHPQYWQAAVRYPASLVRFQLRALFQRRARACVPRAFGGRFVSGGGGLLAALGACLAPSPWEQLCVSRARPREGRELADKRTIGSARWKSSAWLAVSTSKQVREGKIEERRRRGESREGIRDGERCSRRRCRERRRGAAGR